MDAAAQEHQRVALQQNRATIPPTARRSLWTDQPPWGWRTAQAQPMTAAPRPRQLFIQGITRDGKTFRPSDWAERLAGAMSCFRPAGAASGIGAYIGYSPYCVPRVVDGVKSVLVDEALRAIEPMAWDFVTNFARDNNLVVVEPAALPGASGLV
jgi:hypothetical protein